MPNYFSSFRYYTSVPKIVLYFLAGTSHWSWVIYPYFCGIVQRLNIQSYDHFFLTESHWQVVVRRLSRAFSTKRESSSVRLIWELKISVGTCSWSHTHTLKLLCTLFQKLKRQVLSSPTALPGLESSITESQLITSLYLGIIILFSACTLNTPKPLWSQSISHFCQM